MKNLVIIVLMLTASYAFAEYKSHSPTSKTTSPYLHIMDEREKSDLKKEHDINSFQGKEEKLQERQERREKEKKEKRSR